MPGGLGVSSPSITTYAKVMELFSQEATNFILRANASLQRFHRTQVG
jgi:hypothetical protein